MDDVAWTTNFLQSIAPRGAPVALAPALLPDEAHWFRQSIESEVLRVGACRDDCPRRRRWKETTRDEFLTPARQHRHLFSLAASTPRLNREYIPHLAAVGRAILYFGFPPNRFSLSLHRTFQRDCVVKKRGQSYETDAEFYAADGAVVLHLEAKKTNAEITRIATALDRCKTLGQLPSSCAKELDYVLDISPQYLWLVAPGFVDPERYVYAVRVSDTKLQCQRLASLTAIRGV
jgi:hypothetical protein